MGPRDGVLLVAHGTVSDLDDLGAFLARIRGNRPAPTEFLGELRRRYEAVGGSPLLEVTTAQARALAERLERPVLVGMRLWEPSIEGGLAQAGEMGLERVAVIALAPFSVHVYWDATVRAADSVRAAGRPCPKLAPGPAWGTHPKFIEAHAELISAHVSPETPLVLTAHSLPLVALRRGDPYERLVRESAQAIGARLGRSFELAFQSQGEGDAEWLGPDLRSALERIRASGHSRVAVAPFGFLGEHVETLYDLDIEARGLAEGLGLTFVRVPAVGTAAGLIDALDDLARSTLA